MAKIRIRKGNPSGKTSIVLKVGGEKIPMDTENWVEMDESVIREECLNPNFFEIEGEVLKLADDKKVKPKK
jgi:hypothetical protein